MKSARLFSLFACLQLLAVVASAQTASNSPSASIVSPLNGEMFPAPASIEIFAKASASGAQVTNVQIFGDGIFLGNAGMVVLDPPGVNGVVGPVFLLTWPDTPPGAHELTAVASDNSGGSAVSAPVFITVTTAATPEARITSPANRSVIRGAEEIPITIYAHAGFAGTDTNQFAAITNVEVFAGARDLGPAQRLPSPGPPPTDHVVLLPFQFLLRWASPPAGMWSLTAVAGDSQGGSVASAPVNLTILAPPASTNELGVVSVAATDPIAVAGTNTWSWLGPNPFGPPPSWTNWPPTKSFLFTNQGPKDAIFTISRSGPLANDLEISYMVGGVAIGAADYVLLPGVATIPAGASDCLISIVPLMESPNAGPRSVTLALLPPTNAEPACVLGPFSSATALILDDWPRPSPLLASGETFWLNAPAPDGAWFGVEASTNLLDWSSLGTNQAFQGSIDFLDPIAPGDSARFYQVVPLTGPPPNP